MSGDFRIQMLSGRMIDPFDLRPEDIELDDFAWTLANTGGFRCQSRPIYYNAQHVCAVARMVPDRLKLPALHHDDAETIIGDWPTPMKPKVPEVHALEDRIMRVVAERWGFDFIDLDDPELKRCDRIARGVEGWCLMGRPKWAEDYVKRAGCASMQEAIREYPFGDIVGTCSYRAEVWTPDRGFDEYREAHVRYTIGAQV